MNAFRMLYCVGHKNWLWFRDFKGNFKQFHVKDLVSLFRFVVFQSFYFLFSLDFVGSCKFLFYLFVKAKQSKEFQSVNLVAVLCKWIENRSTQSKMREHSLFCRFWCDCHWSKCALSSYVACLVSVCMVFKLDRF